jgi:hypothetical protein
VQARATSPRHRVTDMYSNRPRLGRARPSQVAFADIQKKPKKNQKKTKRSPLGQLKPPLDIAFGGG